MCIPLSNPGKSTFIFYMFPLQNLRQKWVKETTCRQTEVITGQICYMLYFVPLKIAYRALQCVPSNYLISKKHLWESSKDKSQHIIIGSPCRIPIPTGPNIPAPVSTTPTKSRSQCWILSNHIPLWMGLYPVLAGALSLFYLLLSKNPRQI